MCLLLIVCCLYFLRKGWLLYSLQLALEEIDDEKVVIVPRDSGKNDKKKLNTAIEDMRSKGVKIIIGPITYEEFDEVKKYNDLIFILHLTLIQNFQII